MKKQLVLGLVLLGSVGTAAAVSIKCAHKPSPNQHNGIAKTCYKACCKNGGWQGKLSKSYYPSHICCYCKK